MRHLFLISLMWLWAAGVWGQIQNVDSLLNELKTQNLSSEKQLKLYKIILENTGNSRILTECINSGLPLAQKENNRMMESVFNEYKGRIYVAKSMYDSAFIYFDIALELAIDSRDNSQESSVYTSYAVAYGFQSMYSEFIEYQLKALKICEKNDDKRGVQSALGNIGNAYAALNDNKHALQYQEKALMLAEELNIIYAISSAHYALAGTHFNLKNFEKTETHLLKALELSKQVHSNYAMESYILIALSELYNEGITDLDKSEEYGKEGLAIAQRLHNPALLANAYKGLSNIYRTQGRYKDCDVAATKAWELDSVNMDLGISVTANLAYANIHLGNKQKASLFFNKYFNNVNKYNEKSLHDSFTSQEVIYETEKKELRIASLEKEKQLYIWLGIAGVLLAVALAIVLWQNTRNTRKEKQLIATRSVLDGEMGERTRLARDLHDRLGGNLSAVKIGLTNNSDSLENICIKLDSCIDEIRRVAHNLMPVSLQFGLKVALQDYVAQFPNVRFHFFGDEQRVGERKEFIIYCCASELVNNSLRHSEAEHINLQLVQDDKHITLTVQDDGCGFNEKTVTPGIGLKNIRDRIISCNGRIDIVTSPGNGTETTIELKTDNI